MKSVILIVFLTLFINKIKSQSATYIFEKANDEFTIGNYLNAINYCTKALEKNKDLKEVNYLAGLSYYNLKDTINAITYFSKEIQINKTDYRPYLYKAKLNVKNYNQAIDDLNSAITMNSMNFLLYLEKGNLNYNHLKYNLAIEDYTKAITLRPSLDDANYKLGFCNLNLADTINACHYWQKIAELDDFKEYDLIQTICAKHK